MKLKHSAGILVWLLTLCACGNKDVRDDLALKAAELNSRLYPEKEIEVDSIDNLLSDNPKSKISSPEFLRNNIGIFYRSQLDNPKEMAMMGQNYRQFQAIYTNAEGYSFFLRYADLDSSPLILRNKRNNIANTGDFSNPIESRQKLSFKSNVNAIGYIYFNKDDSQGFVNILVDNRYFIEVETKNPSSEDLIRLFIFHLPFDLLGK